MQTNRIPLIIGISGKLGAGKDTVGAEIEARATADGYTCYRRAFADALKEEVALFLSKQSFTDAREFLEQHATADDLDEIIEQTFRATPVGLWAKFKRLWSDEPVHDFSDKYEDLVAAFNDRKRKEQFRRLLQWWGTEFRRKQCDEDYWLAALDKWIADVVEFHPRQKLLIWVPDNRFPNEQKFLEKIGAYTLRIDRDVADDVTAATRNHPSEIALDGYTNFSERIDNNGITLARLRSMAAHVFSNAVAYRRRIMRPRQPLGSNTAVGDRFERPRSE